MVVDSFEITSGYCPTSSGMISVEGDVTICIMVLLAEKHISASEVDCDAGTAAARRNRFPETASPHAGKTSATYLVSLRDCVAVTDVVQVHLARHSLTVAEKPRKVRGERVSRFMTAHQQIGSCLKIQDRRQI